MPEDSNSAESNPGRKDEIVTTREDEEASDETPLAEGGGSIRTSSRTPRLAVYKGRPGMWAYSLHRITGVAIFLFLLIHIADVAAVGWGREAYNTIHRLYETFFFRIMEVGLLGALLAHAINGVRVAIVDFWEEGADRQDVLSMWAVALFIVLFVPGSVWMIWNYFTYGK